MDSIVNARVTAAQMLIRLKMTVPADKTAEVDLVRKWQARIDAAKKKM